MLRKMIGFTLIELLLAVSILGLLLALVLPGFQQTLRQSHRSEAISTLLTLANRQQQYRTEVGSFDDVLNDQFTDSDRYQFNLATATTGVVPLPAGSALPQLSCATSPCFLLAASTTGRQSADTDCALFTLDHLGRKRSYQSDGSQNTPGSQDPCW